MLFVLVSFTISLCTYDVEAPQSPLNVPISCENSNPSPAELTVNSSWRSFWT
jgi:hypothetical protein